MARNNDEASADYQGAAKLEGRVSKNAQSTHWRSCTRIQGRSRNGILNPHTGAFPCQNNLECPGFPPVSPVSPGFPVTGLFIRELVARGDLQRCLIVCPGNLVEQWQDELDRKFHLPFDIMTNDAW